MIGLDTSHVSTFANLLHNPFEPFHIPGAKVVAAFSGGSPDMPVSISRVGGFTAELRDRHGVAILDSPQRVADACDLIFIHASDGRTHPELFRAVAGRGKPVFLDKPFAISASDAEEIFKIAEATGTRVFGSSAFRYADDLVNALTSIRESGERIETCRVRCWLPIQETQGRYFWYGIHAAEMLLAIMGPGVRDVEASGDADRDTIVVRHRDGRESHIDGSRSDGTFEIRLQTDRRQLLVNLASSMPALSARILWTALDVLTEGSFPRVWSATLAGSVAGPRRGRAFDPAPAETIEIVRVLDAAQRSYASRERVPVEQLVLQE
jgi:predicted dehydrogenase